MPSSLEISLLRLKGSPENFPVSLTKKEGLFLLSNEAQVQQERAPTPHRPNFDVMEDLDNQLNEESSQPAAQSTPDDVLKLTMSHC